MTVTTYDWTDVAPGWDAHRAHVETTKSPASRELLDWLGLTPGERVLELGAGTGEFALTLAERVGQEGSVLATDVAPGMVELLRRTTADHANVEVAQLDARDTGLAAQSFDVVVFRMGLMCVDEPERALRECVRVLVAGGRIALAVWAGPEHNPWLACVGMSAMMHGLVSGGPPTGAGGVFSLADPVVLERVVRAAGFDDVAVREVETPASFSSTDEHFDIVTSLAGPLSGAIEGADETTRAAVRETAADAVDRYRTADGLVLPGRALICTARRAK